MNDLAARYEMRAGFSVMDEKAHAKITGITGALRATAQEFAEMGETFARKAAAMAVFAAHAEGKKVRCVTGHDGVTRVQSREKTPEDLGVRLFIHSRAPFTTYSYEEIGRS